MATAGVVTNAGYNYLYNYGLTGTLYLAVGTGTTAPAASDTALVSESARGALHTADISGTQFTAERLFGPSEAASANLTEVGLFSAASGGTCIARALFGVTYAKGAADEFVGTLIINP